MTFAGGTWPSRREFARAFGISPDKLTLLASAAGKRKQPLAAEDIYAAVVAARAWHGAGADEDAGMRGEGRVRVLVACEESQAVTIEMRRLGHEAYSCDLQACSGGHPEWHIVDDALIIINRGGWDLIIAHPPCTYLTSAGAVRLYNADHTIADPERLEKGRKAARFFMAIWDADCPRIAIENPVPMSVFGLPRYSQIIEPYMFGDPWRKRTCLWLKGLPPLIQTEAAVEPRGLWVGSTSTRRDPSIKQRYELHSNRDPKRRSKTFPGIARAMAEQWAGEVV